MLKCFLGDPASGSFSDGTASSICDGSLLILAYGSLHLQLDERFISTAYSIGSSLTKRLDEAAHDHRDASASFSPRLAR